eukprot:gene16138-19203_t
MDINDSTAAAAAAADIVPTEQVVDSVVEETTTTTTNSNGDIVEETAVVESTTIVKESVKKEDEEEKEETTTTTTTTTVVTPTTTTTTTVEETKIEDKVDEAEKEEDDDDDDEGEEKEDESKLTKAERKAKRAERRAARQERRERKAERALARKTKQQTDEEDQEEDVKNEEEEDDGTTTKDEGDDDNKAHDDIFGSDEEKEEPAADDDLFDDNNTEKASGFTRLSRSRLEDGDKDASESEANSSDDEKPLKSKRKNSKKSKKDGESKSKKGSKRSKQASQEEDYNDYDDRPKKNELDEALQNLKRPKKREMEPSERDRMAGEILDKMAAAAEQDINANKKRTPALNKILILPEVEKTLAMVPLHSSLAGCNPNVYAVIMSWLEPLPDGSMPNMKIKIALLKILNQLPVFKDRIKRCGIGKLVMAINHSETETPAIKKMAYDVIHKWTAPPVYKNDDQKEYSSYDEEERTPTKTSSDGSVDGLTKKFTKDDYLPTHIKHATTIPRAILNYTKRPVGITENKASSPVRSMSSVEKEVQKNFLKKPTQKQNPRAFTLSVEGRNLKM